jgi:predicted DNA-binding protein
MNQNSFVFAFRLNEKQYAQLAELAEKAERNRGDYLRLLIRREAEMLSAKSVPRKRGGYHAPAK